jgi:putative nucleotidyltransferase with HDIG domain
MDRPHARFNGSEAVVDALLAVEELDSEIVHALGRYGYALLHSIAVHAQGTFFHSLRVLEMMRAAGYALLPDEAAAVLLHDCGKLVKPGAFAENGGTVRPPAWVLAGHVDHGIAIAEDSMLTDLQRQAIAEHHGDQRTEGEQRYAGDRPTTIFTAVLMMADTMEAISAAQGHERAVQLLGGICESRIQDGQFDQVGADRVRDATRRLAQAPQLSPMSNAALALGSEIDPDRDIESDFDL